MRRFFLLVLAASMGLQAAIIGQMDTFEDGTTQSWRVALLGALHPAPPTNVATGGPSGAGDNYLELTALGVPGPGGRMTAFNSVQWAGDYSALGLTKITMDLRNLGQTELFIRLYLENPVAGPPTDTAITDFVFVPPGSGWVSASFDLSAAALSMLSGSATDLLSNVTVLRVVHSVGAAFPGEELTAVLGVDNICAGGDCRLPGGEVPEPSTLTLIGVGMAMLVLLSLRR